MVIGVYFFGFVFSDVRLNLVMLRIFVLGKL